MNNEHALNIVLGFKDMAHYINAVRAVDGAHDLSALWDALVLDPHWQEWAAGDFNEARTRRQLSNPIPPAAFDTLKAEIEALDASPIETVIRAAYATITAELPCPLPTKAICVLAAPPARRAVFEPLNGVIGSCVGDNILLEINPLASADWLSWVPLVLAHEYNHTVAGYVHFYIKGNSSATLLNNLIFEGLADSFATALFPGILPPWIHALTSEQESEQWRAIQPYLDSTDPADYERFIFGRDGTPAYTGYTLGYNIVQAYRRSRPHLTMADLVMMDAGDLLARSGYAGEAGLTYKRV